ncbi:MAG: hydrolase, partial [Congregibacter sp.]|nr:hydrolase [Congregibacter sp.]
MTAAFASESLLIRQVTPVDAASGVMATQDVLISNGIILSMGQALLAPASTKVIDGRGRFLIPGLWDMHVHLSYDPRLIGSMPDLFLDYGITSVRDTGGNLERLLPLLASHYGLEAQAPRVFFAGPLLDGSPVVYSGNEATGIGQS